ncbi:MAG: hypothetical protein C0467_13680 [Planctomycetaceae bacterium]|nr:hypothetical protein [Planctomycetaceae bacterium]
MLPTVLRELATSASERSPPPSEYRVFDLGCGNGSTAAILAKHGYSVTGVDPSEDGIGIANTSFPDLKLELGSCYDDLAARYGTFPVVLSLEVVEHVFFPRKFAKCIFDLLEPGGIALISTPYHSYWKNLALALSGKMDAHFTALWDYGHIKFWSRTTLTTLLEEAGLRVERFTRVGRIPALAKSMIAIARRPETVISE